MTYDQLKAELRLIEDDPWGTCMSWWFATAAELFERGVYLPGGWQYRPSPMGAIDPDAYESPIVAEATDDDLLRFGCLLDRYTSKLKASGKAY
jgi:hypothetical protein